MSNDPSRDPTLFPRAAIITARRGHLLGNLKKNGDIYLAHCETCTYAVIIDSTKPSGHVSGNAIDYDCTTGQQHGP